MIKSKKNIIGLIVFLLVCKIAILVNAAPDIFGTSFSRLVYAQGGEKNSEGMLTDIDMNIEMMKTLNKRREALDKREKTLEKREEMMHLIEKSVQNKLDEIKRIQGEIESIMVKKGEEASLQYLANVYKTMVPKDAAAQIEKLDMDIAIKVFSKMKSKTSSAVLPFLNPELSKRLSEEVVNRGLIQEPTRR